MAAWRIRIFSSWSPHLLSRRPSGPRTCWGNRGRHWRCVSSSASNVINKTIVDIRGFYNEWKYSDGEAEKGICLLVHPKPIWISYSPPPPIFRRLDASYLKLKRESNAKFNHTTFSVCSPFRTCVPWPCDWHSNLSLSALQSWTRPPYRHTSPSASNCCLEPRYFELSKELSKDPKIIHGQVILFENNCARPFFGSDHNPFNFKGGWVRSMPGIWQSCRLQSLNHDVFDGRPAVGEVPLLPTLHEGGGHAARVRVQILPQDVLRGPLHLRGRFAYCLHMHIAVNAHFSLKPIAHSFSRSQQWLLVWNLSLAALLLYIIRVRASFRAFSLSSASSIVFVHKGAKLLGKKYLLCLPLSVS